MNIQEDYVSFETAKLLKEKGFNQELDWVYSNKNGEIELHYDVNEDGHGTTNDYKDKNFVCIAPTQQMAMKWLREVHKLHIEPHIQSYKNYNGNIYNLDGELLLGFPGESPEQVCETAIKYCLEHLI